MISEARARELDFYFGSDHHARAVTTMVSMAIAIIVVFVCFHIGIGITGTAVLAAMSIVGVLFIRLATYRPPVPNRKLTKQSHQTSLIPGVPLPSRRLIFAEVPAFLLTLWGYLLMPRESEADVVDNRLKHLVQAGREEDAERFAKAASHAGIPLKPDAARFTGTQRYTGPASLPIGDDEAPSQQLSPVQLETGDVIYIWNPVMMVHPGSGAYLITTTINLEWGSIIGEGPVDACRFLFAGNEEALKAQAPLFRVTRGMLADVLLYNLSFSGIPRNPLFLLDVEQGASRIAVVNVHVADLSQVLDKVIWINVRFERCAIVCGGSGFKLRNVTFVECQFSFDPAVPDELRDRLSNAQERPVDANFRM
jgi:hypothetical protein